MAGKAGRRGWGWIRRLPSGRYQGSYIGPDGVRHRAPRTYTKKTDAERWLADERWSIERDEWRPPAQREAERKAKGIILAEFGPNWIEQRPLKPRTKSHYEALFNEHIEPKLGRLSLKDITAQSVRDWHAKTLVDKPTYRAHAYGLLHAMLETAIADEHIAVNPATIKGAAKSSRKRQPVILDVAEVGQLADAIKPERFRAFILISAWLGTRFGETTELRRKDVGEGCEVVTVRRGVTHRDKRCDIDTPKSGEPRKVVVPPHIRPALRHHLKTVPKDDPEALLFPPARGGCHLRDKVFRESYFDPALIAIGRDGKAKPQPSIHDLRHFSGTTTARVGNLVETMGRLGHKTVDASLLYQSVANGRDAEVAQALSRLAEDDPSSESVNRP